MVLIYRVRSFLAEWKSSEQRASITWTNCHFGGRRPFRPHERKILRAASGSAVPRRQLVRVPRLLWLGLLGICLCLIELRYLSGRNGVRSILRVGFVSRSPRLELRRLFGPFVSGPKIPFPGNGDLGSKRLGSNACFSDPEDEHFRSVLEGGNLPVILGPAGWGLPPKRASGPRAA